LGKVRQVSGGVAWHKHDLKIQAQGGDGITLTQALQWFGYSFQGRAINCCARGLPQGIHPAGVVVVVVRD
jgi:hypothetical protein